VLAHKLEVIPAVDVLEGRAVRLRGGRREEVALEGGDPVELARRFADEGASRLHVVDLDGAFTGSASTGLVERLAAIGLPLQVGGGIRSIDAIVAALDAGVDRVMIGTAAVSPAFLAKAIEQAGERLVVAVDVSHGRVAVDGWTRSTELTPIELATRCSAAGVARVLVTSTTRDGSLAGPDVTLLNDVVRVGPPVLAAGGIASLDDLRALADLGCEGAVVGSALLAGRFTLSDAMAAVREA
jgi:phosphoribosylformimino-5-aminoimidazole carboxamide ribotide isomerase